MTLSAFSFAPASKATFLINRLEGWFKSSPKGFYKFTEPCKHRYYKKGDSWIEELGFCRKTFNAAFDLIGTRYKSKTAFLATEDKFKGKLYASYYDRDTNQMFYVRNHDFVESFLKSLFKPKKPKPCRSLNRIPQEAKTQEISDSQLPVRTGKNCRSDGGTIGGYIYIPPSLTKTTTLTRHTQQISAAVDAEMEKIAVEMKKIWVEEIEDFGDARMPISFGKQLYQAFKNLFNGCLERWRKYCRLIASSKFLMGEGNNRTFKKIWITWAIKDDTIQRIENGEFGLNTRTPKPNKKEEDLKIEEQALRFEKQRIEASIETLKELVDCERRKAINQHIENLSETDQEAFKAQFIQDLEAKNDELLKECGDKFWQNKWAHMRFGWFLRARVIETLFTQSLEDAVTERLKQTNLLQLLDEVEKEIEKLTHPVKKPRKSLELSPCPS